MSPREAAIRAALKVAGAAPDCWRDLLDIANAGLNELAAMMPADLAERFRAFLDKETTP